MGNRYLELAYYESGRSSVPLGDGGISCIVRDADEAVLRGLTDEGIEEFPFHSQRYRVTVPDSWSGTASWYKHGGLTLIGETAFAAGTSLATGVGEYITAAETTAPRAIQLKRYEMKNANHYHLSVFRLRVEVADVLGMEPQVFKFRRHDPDAVTGEVRDEFLGVATAVDMSEYPVGAPDPDNAQPFFRKDNFEIDLRSTKDYEDAWDLILREVCVLRAALNRAEELVVAETAWCGDPPEIDSSEVSDSASASSSV